MPQEPAPIDRRALSREARRLHAELVKLRQKLESVGEHARLERPEQRLNIPDEGSATAEDFERALNPVREDLADLALALNRLSAREPLEPPTHHCTWTPSASGETYRVHLDESPRNRTVTIANRGREAVVNPRVLVNGRRNWFSTPTILNEILRPGMSDREKALAIWRFLTDNRLHDEPGHDAIELHDPARFLNVYGYGYCNDAAVNLAVLAQQAGLQARVWGLSGHVVPEVYFEGTWHMLDPDGEIYYLDDDGETICDVRTLERRPDIIRQQGGAYLCPIDRVVEIYATTDDNRVMPWYMEISEARHTMAYVLRPGESLMRSWDNWGLYFSSLYLDEPERYGNGRFTFEPILEGDLLHHGAESVEGIEARNVFGQWTLALVEPGRAGRVVYRFESPYPFLAGTAEIVGGIHPTGSLEVAFSEAGQDWTTIWKTDSAGSVEAAVATRGYFRNGYGRPMYAYSLGVSLTGAAQVRHLRFTSDVQVAPASLPALERGENKIRYVDDSPAPRDVEITFAHDIA